MGTNNNMIINLRFFYHDILSAGLLIKVKIFVGVDGSSLLNFIWNMADTVGIKARFSLPTRIFSRHKLERNMKKKC